MNEYRYGDLKSCPFCGNGMWEPHHASSNCMMLIHDKGCQIAGITIIHLSESDDISKWQTRSSYESNPYHAAFIAARLFIDSHVADPDITEDMCEKYKAFLDAAEAIQEGGA